MITWHHDIVRTLTGQPLAEVAPSAWDGRTVLNGYGDGSHTLKLRSRQHQLPAAQWADLLSATRRTIVISSRTDGGPKVARYAGILRDLSWDRATGTAVVKHKEILSLAELRQLFGVGELPLSGRHFAASNLSNEQMLAAVIARGFNNPAREDQWNLPVRLPVVIPGSGSTSLDLKWWTYTTLQEAITGLTDTDSGSDLYLRPMWDAETGHFYWRMEARAPRFTAQTAEVLLGGRQAGNHPLLNLKYLQDGTKQITGVFQIGKGSAQDMRNGEAGVSQTGIVFPADMPWVDATVADKNESDLAVLDANALEEARARAFPVSQWSCGVLADFEFNGGARGIDIGPGWNIRVDDPGDELLPPSVADQYVIAAKYSSTSKHTVEIDYQP